MNAVNSVQAWAVLLGFITPLIVAVVKRPGMSKQAVQILSLVAAVAIGVINILVQGVMNNFSWSVDGVLLALVAVVGASQAAYVALWKPTGVEPKIDTLTSPTPAP